MGKLFDDLVAESKATPGRAICTIQRIKDQMLDTDRADLDLALAEGSIYGAAIARKLTSAYGIKVNGATVQRHRLGQCNCEPSGE